MKKLKPLPFKKGDKVIFIDLNYGCRLQEATVTLVRQELGIVYTSYTSHHDNVWKQKFARNPGWRSEDPKPLWTLRKLNGDEITNLQKRAKHADKQYRRITEKREEVRRQLDRDTYDWKNQELERRMKDVPDQFQYCKRVAARMGFKQPAAKK